MLCWLARIYLIGRIVPIVRIDVKDFLGLETNFLEPPVYKSSTNTGCLTLSHDLVSLGELWMLQTNDLGMARISQKIASILLSLRERKSCLYFMYQGSWCTGPDLSACHSKKKISWGYPETKWRIWGEGSIEKEGVKRLSQGFWPMRFFVDFEILEGFRNKVTLHRPRP